MLPSYSVVEGIENCLENGTLNVTSDTHAYSSPVMVVGAFLILVMNEVRSTLEFSDLYCYCIVRKNQIKGEKTKKINKR